MKILLIGEERRVLEMKGKIGNNPHLVIEVSDGDQNENYGDYEIIMDLNFDDNSEVLEYYASLKGIKVVLNSVKLQLAEAVYLFGKKIKCDLYGINALPTFIDRNLWEVSVYKDYQKESLDNLMKELGVPYQLVNDRVGMVTPRVLFMIINEACYTVQEGTATIEDIDLAMKLGTNYPYGPFEWADRIGITDIFETLAATYDDTKDERYKICPLLKRKYLRNEPFYKKKFLEST